VSAPGSLDSRATLAPLTGLRGVAACSVLLGHSLDNAFWYDQKNFHPYDALFDYYGMSLFFVLSGFVIQYNYAELFHTEPLRTATYRFFVARFARLYPLYALTILVALPSIPTPWGIWVNLSFLTLTQSWFNVEYAMFPPDWSISTEWFFYLAFIPLTFVVTMVRRPLTVFAVLCLATLVGLSVLFDLGREPVTEFVHRYFEHGALGADAWTWATYLSPWLRLLEFIAGALMARAYQVGSIARLVICDRLLMYAVAWVIVAFVLGFSTNAQIVQNLTTNFIFAPGIALAMLCVCRHQKGALSRLLSSPQMLFLGEISYSIYVWSFVVFIGLHTTFITAHPITIFYLNAILKVPILFAVTIIFAYGSYVLVESPMRRRIREIAG
jgi:peptidoglycan/LPS O-acetylase OafA/YrhL